VSWACQHIHSGSAAALSSVPTTRLQLDALFIYGSRARSPRTVLGYLRNLVHPAKKVEATVVTSVLASSFLKVSLLPTALPGTDRHETLCQIQSSDGWACSDSKAEGLLSQHNTKAAFPALSASGGRWFLMIGNFNQRQWNANQWGINLGAYRLQLRPMDDSYGPFIIT